MYCDSSARGRRGAAAIPAIIPPVERARKRSTANSRSICASAAGVGRFEMRSAVWIQPEMRQPMRCAGR